MTTAALTWPPRRPNSNMPPLQALDRARRCLFGLVDHEQARAFLDQERQRQASEDKKRWNFDFESEAPLEGGLYKWEKVDPLEGAKVLQKQTLITDYMRKRKSSCNGVESNGPKSCRRSST